MTPENALFPDLDVRGAYVAQRDEGSTPEGQIRALRAEVRELTARVRQLEATAREADFARSELSLEQMAILDLSDRLQKLEARQSGNSKGEFE